MVISHAVPDAKDPLQQEKMSNMVRMLANLKFALIGTPFIYKI